MVASASVPPGADRSEPTEDRTSHVLLLRCPDRPGIVHEVTGLLLREGCDVVDSSQFGDARTQSFFLRTHVTAPPATTSGRLREAFAPVGEQLRADWSLHDLAERGRVLLLVSRQGHCLDDLLFRHRTGQLPGDVVGVVSNHEDWRWLVEAHGLPFHHLPVTAGDKPAQEQALLELVARERVDLLVLARYMQVLSEEVCRRLAGRIINIHHSSLPSFSGARPYHQAYERGVKVIGATAHYVTAELDEGPIIEQEVVRVDHAQSPDDLVRTGQDVERLALARAVTWHLEHRVLLQGTRTVVFA